LERDTSFLTISNTRSISISSVLNVWWNLWGQANFSMMAESLPGKEKAQNYLVTVN
jgi:hypothetical protein